MKKVLKIFGIILLIIALTIIGVTVWIYFDSIKAQKKLGVVRSYDKKYMRQMKKDNYMM